MSDIVKKKSIYRRLPFYYGWLILIETFLVYMFMYGLRYSIGIFFIPLQEEFGWTSTMTAGAVTIFFWTYGFIGLLVGRLVNKIGVRKAISLGGIFLGLGGILASLTSELWQLYLSWGVISAVGSSILYTIPNMILSRFFLRHRGKAIGWSSIGVSVGQAIIVPFAASIVESYGWRLSYIVLSSFVLIGTSCLGYIIFRESPESIGLNVDGDEAVVHEVKNDLDEKNVNDRWTSAEALKTRSFKLILASYFFTVGCVISVLTFVVPHIISLGIDPLLASTAFGLIGLMSALGSFIFGFVSDKIGRKYAIIITAIGIALSMFLSTIIQPDIRWVFGWVTFYGLSYGGIPEQYVALLADFFKSKEDISIFGYLMFTGSLGGALFPLVGGYLYDLTGGYQASLIFIGSSMVGALATILLVKPPEKNFIT